MPLEALIALLIALAFVAVMILRKRRRDASGANARLAEGRESRPAHTRPGWNRGDASSAGEPD